MKKALFVLAVLVMAFSVKTFAQKEKKEGGEFKKFKVDVSLGYALPTSSGGGSKGGVLFAIEPKYAVINQLSIGLRMEAAVTVSGISVSSGTLSNNASAKASGSYILTADYYFTNNDLRPFLGAGAGLFTTAGADLNSNNSNVGSDTKFGGIVRGGIEYKHLRLGVEYNLIGKTTVPASTNPVSPAYDIKNGYIGIKLGVCIGGGRK